MLTYLVTLQRPQERLDEYKRLYTIGKVFGIESYVLSPSETKKLYPLMVLFTTVTSDMVVKRVAVLKVFPTVTSGMIVKKSCSLKKYY